MSISAVGAFDPTIHQAISATKASEAGEVAGAADHDGDSDDAARQVQAAPSQPGRIDVNA